MKSRRRRANRRAAAAQPVTPPPAVDDSAPVTADAPAASAEPRPAQAVVAPEPETDDPITDRWFWIGALVVFVVAALIRLPELGLNPFHHDEGVNGWFTTTLARSGSWRYDPANYHGPTLFYFALVSEILFGLTNEAMRLVPVVFGLVTVATVLALRPVLGSIPVLVAGLLLALSPGAVYVSRYFIHEALLVAFTMTLVASALLYLRSRNPVWALGVGASAALIFATKETGVITVVVLAIAAVISGVYVNAVNARSGGTAGRGARRTPAGSRTEKPAKTVRIDGVEYRAVPDRSSRSLLDGVIPGGIPADHVVASTIVFLCVYVLFFSSFFTNFPQGVVDSLATFTIWTQTGGATQVAPIQQYLVWMATADAPILILGTIGGLLAAIQGRSRLWVFIGLWALGITLAYSLVSYKTPWIVLNMLLPLALLGGFAVREAALRPRWRPVAVGAVVLATVASAYLAYDLNFVNYDTDDGSRYPYVYVHSTREMLTMLDQIEDIAAEQGTGTDTGVTIVSPDYWPLPWYLRDYPKAAFWGRLEDVTLDQPIIIANANQREQLEPLIAGKFEQAGTYKLRPGVDLDVYVSTDEAAP